MEDTLNITEEDIQALVDNQLDWEKAKLVLGYVDRNPWAQRYYEQLVRQKKLLNVWWTARQDT